MQAKCGSEMVVPLPLPGLGQPDEASVLPDTGAHRVLTIPVRDLVAEAGPHSRLLHGLSNLVQAAADVALAGMVVEERGGKYFARLTGPQGSGVLTSMSLANGLAIIPEDRAKMEAGEVVKVMMLDWSEE